MGAPKHAPSLCALRCDLLLHHTARSHKHLKFKATRFQHPDLKRRAASGFQATGRRERPLAAARPVLGRKRRLPSFFHPARQDTVPLRGSHHNSTQRIFTTADTLAVQVRWAVEQVRYLGKDHLNANMPLCQRALKGKPGSSEGVRWRVQACTPSCTSGSLGQATPRGRTVLKAQAEAQLTRGVPQSTATAGVSQNAASDVSGARQKLG